MRNERPKRREQKSKARAGGLLVVADFRGNLEAALKELKREAAPAMSMVRRRRSFTPKQTHSARKRRGIERGKRREAAEAKEKAL